MPPVRGLPRRAARFAHRRCTHSSGHGEVPGKVFRALPVETRGSRQRHRVHDGRVHRAGAPDPPGGEVGGCALLLPWTNPARKAGLARARRLRAGDGRGTLGLPAPAPRGRWAPSRAAAELHGRKAEEAPRREERSALLAEAQGLREQLKAERAARQAADGRLEQAKENLARQQK